MKYIVEISKDCWLAEGEGDPCRTLVKSSAQVFKSEKLANKALRRARAFRELPNAVIQPYYLVEGEHVQVDKKELSSFWVKASEKQTEKWLSNKLSEYESNPQKTCENLLVDTTDVIEQYLANRDSWSSKVLLESCLKHNKMFLERIGG